MPYIFTLLEGTDNLHYVYIISVDTDDAKAREDFDRGAKSMDIYSTKNVNLV